MTVVELISTNPYEGYQLNLRSQFISNCVTLFLDCFNSNLPRHSNVFIADIKFAFGLTFVF
jgi:hypothetical protein